ncbi:MAG: hypothetical protein Q4F30_04655 [Akkermansia sp.]|nr:hypothetical protein [Akkermansia sp.]
METLIFLVCLAAFVLGKPRLRYSLPLDGSHVAHERTLMINGFFMVLMLLRHISIFCCPIQPEDEWYYAHIDAPLVQCIVCTYFFYSGYGIMLSLQKKGRLYLRQLLTRRFAGLYVRFGFAAAAVCMMEALIWGNFLERGLKFLYTMVGCGSWWFIVMSLVLYLLTWLSFSVVGFSPERPRRSLVAILILSILVAVVVSLMFPYKPTWWLDTEWCFPAGMLYALYGHRLEFLLNKSRLPALVWGLLLVSASLWALHHFRLFAKFFGWLSGIALGGWAGIHYTSALACFFALGVTWIFASVTWSRVPRPLVWLGQNAFYLFLFQYVPMKLFRDFGISASHPRLSILLAFILAIGLAALMKWVFLYAEHRCTKTMQ